MHLGENVQIFVLIHRGLVGFIDEDVILVAYLFDLSLHHPIVIVKTFVGVLSLTDSQLQLLFYLFLGNI